MRSKDGLTLKIFELIGKLTVDFKNQKRAHELLQELVVSNSNEIEMFTDTDKREVIVSLEQKIKEESRNAKEKKAREYT